MTDLFAAALSTYEQAKGLDRALPGYDLQQHEQRPVAEFFRSLESHLGRARSLKPVEISADGEYVSITVSVIVTSLRLIKCPDEESTTETEVVYYEYPDWVGTGLVMSGGKVVNRVHFVVETTGGDDPNKITSGVLQFLDEQPSGYR